MAARSYALLYVPLWMMLPVWASEPPSATSVPTTHRFPLAVEGGVDYYSKEIAVDPSNDEYHHRRGLCYMDSRQYSQAVADFDMAIKFRDRVLEGGTLGSVDTEKTKLNTAFSYQNRAYCYLMVRNYAKAVADLSRAISLRPDYRMNYMNRAKAYELMGKPALAMQDRKTAAALKPEKTLDSVDSNTLLSMAFQSEQQNAFEQAIPFYNAALQLKPEFLQAYSGRARCYKIMGQFNRALDDYNHMLRLAPHDKRLREEQLKTSQLALQYATADKQASRAPLVMPSLSGNNFGHHVDQLTVLLKQHPADVRVLKARASAYQGAGKFDKGISDMNQVLAIDPNDGYAYLGRAVLYKGHRDFAKAVDDFTDAWKHLGDTLWGSATTIGALQSILFGRASCHTDLGRYHIAVEDYDRIIRMEPDNEEALRLRGDCFYKLGDYEKAVADYSKSIANDSVSAGSTMRARAKAFDKLGKSDLAAIDRENARKLGF